MKKSVKGLSMLFVIALLVSIAILPASASGYSATERIRGASLFSTEWEYTVTFKVGSTVIAYMIYGYDMDWTHEDYVWTKSLECYSIARVFRDGYDTVDCVGPRKGINTYSKIEVTHQTYYVDYKMDLTATYSNVKRSKVRSHVK